MTRRLLTLVVLLACGAGVVAPEAVAAPTVTVRARTRIRLITVARTGEEGIRVIGVLADAQTGDGVPGRLVSVRMGDRPAQGMTDRDGSFYADFDLPAGVYDVTARFAGDELYAGAQHEGQRFDVGKDSLHLSLRARGDLSPEDEALDATLEASSTVGPQSVQVELFVEDAATEGKGRSVDLVTTGSDGGTAIRIPRGALGRAGDKRLHARFFGNDAFNPAEATARFRLSTATQLEGLRAPEGPVRYEGKIKIGGRLVEQGGHGVEGATVALLDGAKQITATTTDRTGKFSLAVSASEFTPGPVVFTVEHTSQVAWRRGVKSAPLEIVVAEPRPVPVSYSVIAFVATALALVTFLLLRAKPWVAWAEKWRRRRRPPGTAPEPTQNGGDAPAEAGLKPARPGIMSTLRRAADFGFSGRVRDVVKGHGVAGATVTLTLEGADPIAIDADEQGAFALERIPPGVWRARAAARGYVTEAFHVTIPHRGELRGVRVDLLPVRERVFAIYRGIAAPLLPKPELWGLWTPREIFRYVRKKRPAGALGALTNFVEETYFSARVPDEAILPSAIASAEAARHQLTSAD